MRVNRNEAYYRKLAIDLRDNPTLHGPIEGFRWLNKTHKEALIRFGFYDKLGQPIFENSALLPA